MHAKPPTARVFKQRSPRRLGDHSRYPTRTRGTSILAKSLQIITGLLGTAIRSFAFAVMILETLWGVILASLCFWLAAQGSTIRGTLAAVLAFILVTACTLIVAVYFASLTVVRKAVSNAALGRTIFDNLFDYALGISGEDIGEQSTSARIPTHMSREEVEKTLNDAAKNILSNEYPSTKWAGPFFWLAKQIQRISIWATVRVVVESCSRDGKSVNMFELRDRLASTIDEGVVSYLKHYFTRLASSVITAVSLMAMLLALGVRQLPL